MLDEVCGSVRRSRLRIKAIKLDSGQTTIRLDRNLANIIRELASFEKKGLSDLLNDMVLVYCRQVHPDKELEVEDVQ